MGIREVWLTTVRPGADPRRRGIHTSSVPSIGRQGEVGNGRFVEFNFAKSWIWPDGRFERFRVSLN